MQKLDNLELLKQCPNCKTIIREPDAERPKAYVVCGSSHLDGNRF